CRQQRLPRVIESQQVSILGEKLADRNIALLRRQRLGGDPPPGLIGTFHGLRFQFRVYRGQVWSSIGNGTTEGGMVLRCRVGAKDTAQIFRPFRAQRLPTRVPRGYSS